VTLISPVVQSHYFCVPIQEIWITEMNEEQMLRAIEFITQSLAESVARNAIIEENFKEFQAAQKKLEANEERLQAKLENLVDVSRNLVTVAQIHSRRLDRLEGIQPR
jgi:hypothetical protein